MSATIMSEAEATTLHLQLHMQQRSTATTLTWPNAFRSLISYAATDAYGDLTRFKLYPIRHVDSGHKGIGPLRASSYEPFLSDERCLWLFDSFTEEKAHRHAIQVSG